MLRNIRPRDKSPTLDRERERQTPSTPRQVNRFRPIYSPQMMMKPRNNSINHGATSRGFPPRSSESSGNSNWNPYPLLSKTLTVANIPPEYTPKNLYELFDDFGKAEATFMYAFPDTKGRRVGEVVMATYLFAQKVCRLHYILTVGS